MGPSNRCEQISCKAGFMFSAAQNSCVIDPNYVMPCGANQYHNKKTNKCECRNGHYYSS